MGNKNAKPDKSGSGQILVEDENSKFREIRGRQFHNENEANTKYLFPCDTEEQNRLTLQHYVLRDAWQSNFSAPVHELLSVRMNENQPRPKVLDVGCGTGIWLLEMASEYPKADFYGVDIVPVFPQDVRPDNVTFQLGSVINGLPFPDETFDYVFMRFMCLAFSEEQWREKVIKEILRLTKVGGYIELFDFNVRYTVEGPSTARILSLYRELLKQRGVNPFIISESPKMLAETGQLELPITVEQIDIPVGNWGGKVGEQNRQNAIQVFETIKAILPQTMDISVEELEGLLQKLPDEFEVYKSSLPSGRAYSRKTKNNE